MNKKYKILFSICAVFVFAFSFFLVNFQPLYVKADSIPSSHSVSFIAPDNSLLISFDGIPNDVSLSDVESANIVDNSYFKDVESSTYYNTQTYNEFNIGGGWYLQSNTDGASNVIVQSNGYGISVSRTGNQGYTYLKYPISVEENTTYYYSFCVDGVLYTGLYNMYNYPTSYNAYTVMPFDSDVGFFLRFEFSNSGSGIYSSCKLNIGTSSSVLANFHLDYIYIGELDTGYFNHVLVDDLLSEYTFSNYYYQYNIDYSQPITSDMYYYPQKITIENDTWIDKNWGGLSSFDSSNIWTDGVNFYYSAYISSSRSFINYILDVSTSNWQSMTWNGTSSIYGYCVWTDGSNIYCSYGTSQYLLDTSTNTWSSMSWSGLSSFYGSNIWTDGTNIYYSANTYEQYVLDTSDNSWSQKTWNGFSSFSAYDIWSDGTNIYCSSVSSQYVLDVATSTWSPKTWSGLTSFAGRDVWSDGQNYYYSNSSSQYVLDVVTSTWFPKTWSGLTSFAGRDVWSNNFGVYYSNSSSQYVLGSSLLPLDSTYYYNQGYDIGYDVGYTGGYNIGYNKGYGFGVEDAGNYTFFSLISAVMDAPLKVFYGLFNFDLMGVNLAGFIQALLSLAILLFIIRFALQK